MLPTRPIVLVYSTEHARADIIDIYCRNARPNPESAEHVFDAIQRAVTLLTDAPGVGRLWNSPDPRLKDMRVTTAGPYANYLILFRPVPHGIEVARVVAASPALQAIINDASASLDNE